VENLQPEVQIEAENVVRLADYRAKRRARAQRAATAHGWGPQYYCLRCDGDEFKLYASGVVHCAHCGSLMRNLFISGSKSEEPAQ
jgi:ribosomal protein L37AE/L43A